MILKREALHIQQTKHDADDVWWQWHLCYWCEAWETGRPEAEGECCLPQADGAQVNQSAALP